MAGRGSGPPAPAGAKLAGGAAFGGGPERTPELLTRPVIAGAWHGCAGKLTQVSRQRFAAALLQHITALVSADAAATAELLTQRLPDQQTAALSVLQQADPSGHLPFAFLRAVLRLQQRRQSEAAPDEQQARAHTPPTHSRSTRGACSAPPLAVLNPR